jgi:hypothetical protein
MYLGRMSQYLIAYGGNTCLLRVRVRELHIHLLIGRMNPKECPLLVL